MKTRILIHQGPALSVAAQPLEIVERKGKGHPDTICDAIAEAVSIQLSKAYQETFGRILHHNIDKCLLVAGQVLAGMVFGQLGLFGMAASPLTIAKMGGAALVVAGVYLVTNG